MINGSNFDSELKLIPRQSPFLEPHVSHVNYYCCMLLYTVFTSEVPPAHHILVLRSTEYFLYYITSHTLALLTRCTRIIVERTSIFAHVPVLDVCLYFVISISKVPGRSLVRYGRGYDIKMYNNTSAALYRKIIVQYSTRTQRGYANMPITYNTLPSG